jgi:hypothetical protein
MRAAALRAVDPCRQSIGRRRDDRRGARLIAIVIAIAGSMGGIEISGMSISRHAKAASSAGAVRRLQSLLAD